MNRTPANSTPLLAVDNLCVNFASSRVVDHVSFSVGAGEKFALVGESGSGKSVTALSILKLVETARYEGAIRFQGEDVLAKTERQMQSLRGSDIAMIFQEPMTALNPLYRVGNQIAEVLELHEGLNAGDARARAVDLLARTGIPDPVKRVDSFPHQLSGGQRQRAMIAMALACRPKLLIADEPTTALDVTIQAQILKLMRDLKKSYGSSILLITHNLGVVAEMCDRVGVMYAGTMAEIGDVRTIFKSPLHPYTAGLMKAVPAVHQELDRLNSIRGSVPNLITPPSGCRFHPRCDFAKSYCTKVKPELVEIEPGHFVSCHKVSGAKGYV